MTEDDRPQSYGKTDEEDILRALTTRDFLGLGPLEIRLLQVTVST